MSSEVTELELPETPDTVSTGVSRVSSGFEVAIRGSYGVPFGSSRDGVNIRRQIAGLIPAQLDLGYRFDEHWFVGAFAAGGIGVKGAACREREPPPAPDGETPLPLSACDAPNNFRLGLQVHYHLLPVSADVSPWVGIGVGYEWLNLSETLSRRTFVQTFSGPELVNVQGGVDFAIGSRLRVGPFAQWVLGRYLVAAASAGGGGPLPTLDHTMHHWLNIGIKASVGPFGP